MMEPKTIIDSFIIPSRTFQRGKLNIQGIEINRGSEIKVRIPREQWKGDDSTPDIFRLDLEVSSDNLNWQHWVGFGTSDEGDAESSISLKLPPLPCFIRPVIKTEKEFTNSIIIEIT